jgi:K+ transporter
VLVALDPLYGVDLFVREPWTAFVALGSVVLAVTGCEALYADMGHFGRSAIRTAWLFIAFPALVVNYFGQGALILHDPAMTGDAFYGLAPSWAHYPLIALATVATIIASQAVISGAFSITKQAVQLGQLPRMEIRHTSATEYGQIYVPRINALLCTGVVLIVLVFKSSDALGTAYGIAVTGVMLISTILVAIVAVAAMEVASGSGGPRVRRTRPGGRRVSLPPTVSRSSRADGCRWRRRSACSWSWTPGASAGACTWRRCARDRWQWTFSWSAPTRRRNG